MSKIKRFEDLSPQKVKSDFLAYMGYSGYEFTPNGFPITDTINPNTLTFVNSSIAPFIPAVEDNMGDPTFTTDQASVQPSVRLDILDNNRLLSSPHYTQAEVKTVLENAGFEQIEFHKVIKANAFNEKSEGNEFDIVVTARKKE